MFNQRMLIVTVLLALTACQQHQPAQEKFMSVHRDALVIDAHADIEIPGKESRYAGADGLSKVEQAKMQAGGVDAVIMSISVGPMPRNAEGYAAARAQALAELNAVIDATSGAEDQLVLATSAAELVAAHENGQQALLLGLQNALILGEDADAINWFYEQGVRMFALTHMGHNDYADSSRPLYLGDLGRHEPVEEHGGLSPLGITAVKNINQLGAVLDISQLSRNAALQAIELSAAPVVASHSNVRALCNVTRNLSDEEIDAIAARGGVVHVAPFLGYLFDTTDVSMDKNIRAARRAAGIEEDYYYPFELYWEIDDAEVQQQFLARVREALGTATVDDLLNHVDYIANRVGIDHVGIGTDFNHGSGIEGFNDASEAANVTRGLLARGYSAADIQKIWGGNFLRVWRAAEAGAEH